jgi:hypothetical protein
MIRSLRLAAVSAAIVLLAAFAGELQVIDHQLYHLGQAGEPEWQEFADRAPDGKDLTIRFSAHTNATECTLFIRQSDVKFNWAIQLNGHKIGQLHLMESPLVHVLPIPPRTLRDGENTLTITAPTAIDDILAGEVKLDPRPLVEALSLATLEVAVSDAETDNGVPCRITLVDERGALAPLYADSEQRLAVRPGVAYTRDGRARIGVVPGDYTIYATRGFEYSLDQQSLSVALGETVPVRLQIRREVPTPGLASCDTHIHTLTYSGHGDATIDERMLTIAGEGIEFAVATDHNYHTSYEEPARRSGLAAQFTPAIGNEVTTKTGHFNAFPIAPDSPVPDFELEEWPRLMRAIRSTPGVRVVVLNHPRNLHSNFQPFGDRHFNPVTGENRRGAEFSFDAVEVLTSAALQSDPMLLYRDWFALLNFGYRMTAVGSSDSHEVSRFIVGQGRSYVACRDDDPARIDVEQACRSFLDGRVLVSMGLLAEMRVHNRFSVGDLATELPDQVRVEVRVLGPSWVQADRVELFANGVKIREQAITPSSAVEKAVATWMIPRPPHDVHLVAIASGPGVTAPCWAIPRPYQATSRIWTPRVLGSTNPIWLDADGDRQYTSPRTYAAALVQRAGDDPARLIQALASFDRAVATQAASLLHSSARHLRSPDLARLLENASDATRQGFAEFQASLGTQ